MEAVPRLPMLSFPLKISPEGTSFISLKKYIAECYQEDPESYSKECYQLETLRNSAIRPTKDVKGCSLLKRYYCQLHSLSNRFPQLIIRNLFTFTWKDLYSNNLTEVTNIRYEMAAILYNIAAIHTQLGAQVNRTDIDGMKLACTHYQCAAWAFGELKDKYSNIINSISVTNGNNSSVNDFLQPELLLFMQQISFAQAQECILEKSLIDNRKPSVVAKVTSQIINYYSSALVALLTGGDDGQINEIVGYSVCKEWKKYVKFKISYLNSVLLLYQGMHAEEQKKMGHRVVLYQAAWDKLEEARKEAKGMLDFQKEISETLIFTADVVEAKRKMSTNENEFIYHETVPNIADIPAIQGANLVNGISFSVTDPEVAGEDIFARLVPMKAHEASSLYSEEKAQLLRKIGAKIEEKDNELNTYMSSLNIDHLNVSEERANKIPQGIVDRCASLNAKTNAIPDLIVSMSNLAEICADVETNLKEIKELLNEEVKNEKHYQQKSGVHRSNVHFTELSREFQKYMEAHQKAGESNDTLRRAMELHVNNLRILSRPLQDIQSSVPKLSGEFNENVFHELKLLLNKVNEMKAQRAQFHADLRIAINDDDITSKVIALGDGKDLKELFKKELTKHDKICNLIEQNLTAQGNILSALTEAYAKCAPLLKTLADVKHKKENFFSSLAASYDVYEDLLAKSAKGLEFYKKLQGNVQKLLARVRAARDVQDEERQQRLKQSTTPAINEIKPQTFSNSSGFTSSSTPKLKDYLKSGKFTSGVTVSESATYIPPVRPNPLGSEAPNTSSCINPSISNYYTTQTYSQAPNEPPPPYVINSGPMPSSAGIDYNGYINPIYQNNQNIETSLNYGQYASQLYQNSSPNNNSQMYSAYQQVNLANYQVPEQQQGLKYPQQQVQNDQQQYQYSTTNSISMQYPSQNLSDVNQANQYYSQSTQPAHNSSAYSQQNPPIVYSVPQVQPATPTVVASSPYNSAIQSTSISSAQQVITSAVSSHNNQMISSQLPTTIDISSGVISHTKYQQPIPTSSAAPQTALSPAATVTYVGESSNQIEQNPNTWNIAGLNNQMENLNIQSALNQNNYGYYSTMQLQQQQQQQQQQNTSIAQLNQIQQYGATPISSASTVTSQNDSQTSSYSSHPGYVFNQITGEYQYASGYQNDPNIQQMIHSQYTNATVVQNSNTTDSTNPSVDGQTFANQYSVPLAQFDLNTNQPQQLQLGNVSYYNVPYGYQTTQTIASNSLPVNSSQIVSEPEVNLNKSSNGGSTYMQSNSYNGTQTTVSENYGDSVVTTGQQQQQQQQQQQNSKPTLTPTPTPTAKKSNKKTSSNIDLLSDIDFSSTSSLPEPQLQPQPAISAFKTEIESVSHSTTSILQQQSETSINECSELPIRSPFETISDLNINQRKLSCDNLSVCSDLSSLDQNLDWDSISIQSGTEKHSPNRKLSSTSVNNNTSNKDSFDDPKILKYFHKEVERYERMIESLNIKMLNGNTPLVAKWNELQDLLVKNESKRTTTIGKLFPDKNRSNDCIPYDHARVILERSTDDYINAAYIKDLGPKCPTFILTQTPLQNTLNDFWSMVWSQKSRTLVCLHTPNEILDTFWPQQLNQEMHFDDFTVILIKQFDLSHCIELHLKLTKNGADAQLDLSLIQIKAWTKSSPSQILGIAQNILLTYKQKCQEFLTNTPLIINCLTGSERSGVIAVAICAILATQTRRPILINVVDVWYRICSQRKSALRDADNLQLSMQIVLCHAHDVLNKRGIMTSYQMKNAQIAATKEREEIKDPLNDLDPLWKLKQK